MTCKVRHWVLNYQLAQAILTGQANSERICKVQMNLINMQAQMMHLTGRIDN
jgi:hypothetical protein